MNLTNYSSSICYQKLKIDDIVYFESYNIDETMITSGIGLVISVDKNFAREYLISVTSIIDGTHHVIVIDSVDYFNDVILPLGYENELTAVLDYLGEVYTR